MNVIFVHYNIYIYIYVYIRYNHIDMCVLHRNLFMYDMLKCNQFAESENWFATAVLVAFVGIDSSHWSIEPWKNSVGLPQGVSWMMTLDIFR